MKFCKPLLFLFLLFTIKSYSQNQDSTINWDIFNMSLEELMNVQVTIASKNITNLRESPGIISVITESEIKASGARDLIDILNLVPGIDFGSEWDNILGVGVRGNNATEGKLLILLDGFQLNETNFGTFPFGQHILPNNIKRIEIVRGPGSVVYGGSAELAVINIITSTTSKPNFKASSDYSIAEGNTLRYNIQSTYNGKINKGLGYNISGYYGIANRSNWKYTTLDTSNIDYLNNSSITSANINTSINYKSINLQFIYDKYLSDNTEEAGQVLFEGYFTGLGYKLRLNKFSLNPKVSWVSQKPWNFVDFKEKEFYNSINNRFTTNITLGYNHNDKINVIAGVEYFLDKSQKANDTVFFSLNNKNDIKFNSHAFFGELMLKSNIVNLTAGARYDLHDEYGDAFVPRIALTKAYKKLHFKALYSQAFKAPTISNIDYNSQIKPERTSVLEFEMGYQFYKNMNLAVNLFDITINDPILYIPNPVTGGDYYTNYDKTGSRGLELIYKIKPNWGYLNVSYSYYEKNKNTVEQYNIEGNSKTYGAFPMHKASINSDVKITKNINFNYTALFYGDRYTFVHTDKNWNNAKLVKYEEQLIFNIFFTYQGLFIENLNISAGIYDITNSGFEYINAYQGWQNPIPAPGREITIRLFYQFG